VKLPAHQKAASTAKGPEKKEDAKGKATAEAKDEKSKAKHTGKLDWSKVKSKEENKRDPKARPEAKKVEIAEPSTAKEKIEKCESKLKVSCNPPRHVETEPA